MTDASPVISWREYLLLACWHLGCPERFLVFTELANHHLDAHERPLDREHIVLTMEGKPIEIELVHVKDAQAGLVWLISSRTLAQVPALSRSSDDTWLMRLVPQSLGREAVLGITIASAPGKSSATSSCSSRPIHSTEAAIPRAAAA